MMYVVIVLGWMGILLCEKLLRCSQFFVVVFFYFFLFVLFVFVQMEESGLGKILTGI